MQHIIGLMLLLGGSALATSRLWLSSALDSLKHVYTQAIGRFTI